MAPRKGMIESFGNSVVKLFSMTDSAIGAVERVAFTADNIAHIGQVMSETQYKLENIKAKAKLAVKMAELKVEHGDIPGLFDNTDRAETVQ